MTYNEINIAVCEARGFMPETEKEIPYRKIWVYGGRTYCECDLPELDLNAMHEVENLIVKNSPKRTIYVRFLRDITADIDVWHATARQRAEAFLRTIGKWKE